MAARGLGRRVPTDFKHLDKYPLRTVAAAAIAPPTPMVIGVNWYAAFDRPERVGNTYWIGRGDLGRIRGGHCVCLLPHGLKDADSWWSWFNQVDEGICVTEGVTRAVSLVTRKRFQPRPLYDQAQLIDEYEDTPPAEGTSVRAGLSVVLNSGLVVAKSRESQELRSGVITREPTVRPLASYHWITGGMDEVREVLSLPSRVDYVEVLNSWGRDYPHKVRMPLSTLDRLREEDGELGVPIFAR